MLQILDVPVPQMVEQLPDVLRFFATLLPVPEQVIEVSKILLDDVRERTAVRVTQLAEQLVEVPTIVSYSSLQRTMEQHVDIPVPRRGGRIFKVFFPDRVRHPRFLLQCAFSEWIVEQIVDIPVEAFKIFAQDRVHPLLRIFQLAFKKAWMSLVKGFFRTFPQI